jgi:nucleotide-binding universal stress UspA family protein
MSGLTNNHRPAPGTRRGMAIRPAGPPILVGDDGSSRGRDAIALGRHVAELLDAPIEVVSVHPYTPLSSRIGGEGWTAMTAAEAEAALERAQRALAGRDGVTYRRFAASSPVLGLDLAAEEAEAEMIVVGSTGRGRLGRLLPGTTADQLFAHARCPVAIAPVGYADRATRTGVVGVAYDDGPESRDALTYARRLCDASGATLRLVGVFDSASYAVAPRSYGAPADAEHARDRAYVRLEKVVGELPCAAEAQFLEGAPADRLAEASAHLDLMVVGSHGRGVLRRAVLGSVSSELVAHAACPVVVVPRGTLPTPAT